MELDRESNEPTTQLDVSRATARHEEEPVLRAEGIGVDASWGHIYGPVDLTVRRGGVTVLVGSGGRGRTALLLTLAGRMKPTTGTLTGFGKTKDAQHLFSNATIAHVNEVDGIGQTIRVSDIVTEQIRWAAPWYAWVPPATEEDLERICRPVFGDYSLPTMDAMVEELPEFTNALFRIAVANIRKPPLLVVGGIDNLTSVAAASKLLDRLIVLGKDQTVITADVNGVALKEGITEVIEVHNLTDHQFAVLEHEAFVR
ncbi:ATP-binding cassette domain-containing protein [Leucobacter viscericola]|uniref:ATP-binding cassette domain-containing protein n=1 Tax=Leucobacter viscericola TaxID=2714935 RepID=A0A6G7XJC5_9MICO|nr:ATP-binding cassette domain-containing protein [Leucobacter viscericola]QIK64477.1 ATP-binding cassette domain-containing protein [Leucobacter viscericola]